MSRAGAAPAASPEGTRRVAGAGFHPGVPSDARVVAEVGLAHAVSHFHQLALVPLLPALREAFAFLNPARVACMAFFVTINIAMIGLQGFGATLLQAAWGDTATAAAGTLAAAALIALLAAHAVPVGAAGALACAAGFAIGTVAPSRDMLVRASTPPGATGRAYGVVYAGVDVGAALGLAIVGAWLVRGLPEAGYASASLALLATALLGLEIARRARRLPVSSRAPKEPSR